MEEAKIVMYVKDNCSDVDLARAILQERGKVWDEIDIVKDAEARAKVLAWNDGRAITPTIWIGNKMLAEPTASELIAAIAD
jgi:glutaredoxin